MLTVDVQDATANLSDLLARAERGEEVWIARDGIPVVRLVPAERKPRQSGIMNGPDIPESFFEPMTEGGLAAWE